MNFVATKNTVKRSDKTIHRCTDSLRVPLRRMGCCAGRDATRSAIVFAAMAAAFSAGLAVPRPASADIFQWEYINPANPSQGKRQSTTLAPGGAGLNAVPNANLSSADLTMAWLIGADVTSANFNGTTLTNADLLSATLIGANFIGADVRGANFAKTVDDEYSRNGLTAAQLYSTASYQNHDLSGINLGSNDLSGWNFAGQNLTNANFNGFTGFYAANLTGANFTGAEVRGASLPGLSAAQLYSTASYQNRDLRGITLGLAISGANFAGQNLSGATFQPLTQFWGSDFSHANLTNVRFWNALGHLNSANLTAADARGAPYFYPDADVTTTNLIFPDGHVAGLDLTGGQSLLVRNYHGNPLASDPRPIAILIEQSMTMDPTGALRVMLDSDEWDSLISFAPGIPVTLGGTLELAFTAGTDVNAEIGRTFQIFDWSGVTPTGSFSVASPHAWDLSRLYTSGEVTLIPEPASLGLFALAALGLLARQRPFANVRNPSVISN